MPRVGRAAKVQHTSLCDLPPFVGGLLVRAFKLVFGTGFRWAFALGAISMSQSKTVRWGILGVAKINERLLPAFAKSKHAKVVALASRETSRARAAADACGIPIACGSYEDLVRHPEVDVVYNPLPNHLHAKWTREAIEHGKTVLCEKPLCPTAKEALELVEWVKTKNGRLMDGFMWPHHPRTARLRKLLDSNLLGPVQRVHGSFTFLMDPVDPNNIRLKPEMGGGSLLDVGCYPVYGIRWAMGAEPVRVFAHATFLHGVDIDMTGLMEFEDGRVASFDCGFNAPMRMGMEIVCGKGVVRVPRMWLPSNQGEFQVEHEDGSDLCTVEGYDQITCMIDHLSEAFLHHKPATPSPYEAVKSLRVMDALALSAREGKPVMVVRD